MHTLLDYVQGTCNVLAHKQFALIVYTDVCHILLRIIYSSCALVVGMCGNYEFSRETVLTHTCKCQV